MVDIIVFDIDYFDRIVSQISHNEPLVFSMNVHMIYPAIYGR